MTKSTAFRAVDFFVEQSRNSDWIELTFIGGEPLLEYDLIKSTIRYAQDHSIRKEKNKRIGFTITTNGTLLEEEHVQFFHDNKCRYLLSLDGASDTNDAYRKMRNGQSQYEIIRQKMPMLKSYQPWQGARVTVLPQTARQLAKNIETLHRELKINQFVIGFATGTHWTDETNCRLLLCLKRSV